MAGRARSRGVRREVLLHGGALPLRFGVTAQARRLFVRRERMTREAIGLLRLPACVRVPGLLGVTTSTRRRSGALEPRRLVVVAALAHDLPLADVLLVPRARAVRGPRRRHELRGHARY